MSDAEAREVYAKARLGESVTLGSRPVVLVVDFSCGFTDPSCALGSELTAEVESTKRLLDVARGDIFLLCSDGLTRPVADETIVHTLRESTNGEQASARLIDLAKEKGAPDNVTVVLVYC